MKDNRKVLTTKLAKKCLPIAAALVPLSAVPLPAEAAVSIVLSGTIDLNFGEMTVGTGGGTVSISSGGVRSRTGTINLISGAGLESQAVLSISGSTGVLIDVSMTAGAFTVDDVGAGAPMTVNAFDINGSGASLSLTLTTNPATFPMGATITVPPGQAAGVYSGSYSVFANYQ